MTETEFRKQSIELLELNGFMVFPQNAYRAKARYKNGTADLIVMCPRGLFYSMELKTETGSIQQSQLDMKAKFRAAGFEDRYMIVRPSNLEIFISKILAVHKVEYYKNELRK